MKYKAFISYRHSPEDSLHAKRLESALKKYAKPLWRAPLAIFRDERVLRTGDDLPTEIRVGLESSEFLIYLASRGAAQSEWVQKEVRYWCDELKRSSRLLPVHISDRVRTDAENGLIDWENTDAIPRGITSLPSLPVWADLTWATKEEHLDLSNVRYKTEINAIVAKLRGVLPGTMNDVEVITHRRNMIVRNVLFGAVAASAAIAAWFGVQAQRSEREALKQAGIASEQRNEARKQAGIAHTNELEAKRQSQEAQRQANEANRQKLIAEDQRDAAVAAQLVAQANEFSLTRPDKVVDATAMLLRSAASRPTPEAGFALRERLGQLARPVFRNGKGAPLVGITFFFDGVASWRNNDSGELGYVPWTPGESIGRADEPLALPKARLREQDDSAIIVADGTVSWERRHRGLIASASTKEYPLFDVAFPPSGPPIIAGTRDGKIIEILKMGGGKRTLSVPGQMAISLLVFSADTKWLAAARFHVASGADKAASEVTIFDAETGQIWTKLETSGTMSDFAFSPAGDLAAALEAGGLTIWDVAHKGSGRDLDFGSGDSIDVLSGWDRIFFSNDGTRIGSAGDSRLRVWEAATGTIKLFRNLGSVARWITFSEKDNLAAVTDAKGNIQVWDVDKERMTSFVPVTNGHTLVPLRFGHVSHMLQVTDDKGNVQLWQIADQEEKWSWPHTPMTWLPDGRRLLVSEDTEFYLWSIERGSVTVSNDMPAAVSQLAVRPDGAMVAVADSEGSVRLFGLPDLTPGPKTTVDPYPRVLKWAPGGKSLLVVTARRIYCWTVPGLAVKTVAAPAFDADKVAFSPDGRYFTVGYAPRNYGNPGSPQPLQLWDSKTGKVAQQVAHGKVPEYVAFAAHAPYLVTSAQGLLRVWRYPEMREVAKWKVSEGFNSIALSQDGSTVAAVSEDVIGLWNVPTGERLGDLKPAGRPESVAFTPDSRTVVAISEIAEGSALVEAWTWPQRETIARFPATPGSGPEITFSPDGAFLVFRHLDHIDRYLWRTQDLVSQGCRTLAEVAPSQAILPSPCAVRKPTVPNASLSKSAGTGVGSAGTGSNPNDGTPSSITRISVGH